MRQRYLVEVPIYSKPVPYLAKLNCLDKIRMVVYGGVPDSPLNGGRFNYTLDGLFFWNRLFFRLTPKQRSCAIDRFYQTVSQVNQAGIPFLVAFTNMFVSPAELSEENLFPIQRIIEIGKKYGVTNGLILNNPVLEKYIRKTYQQQLIYVSSCTKYVLPDKILTPQETLSMYQNDIPAYDFVTLTPQDSRREDVLGKAVSLGRGKIIAICNSYCSYRCNSYHHYASMSLENKKSLLTVKDLEILLKAFTFIVPRASHCPALMQSMRKINVGELVKRQLRSGIVNFKLGRGFGADCVDQVISAIQEFEKDDKKE